MTFNYSIKSILILVLFLLVWNSYSQEKDSIKNYLINEVKVTATRNQKLLEKTPEVMHVITTEEIKALNVSSTGELLEYLTGVNVESGTGSGFPKRSIVSLDGFPANYSLVMVDGIRLLTEHIHTGQNIDIIPPENIERIEVIKGASSAQYGSDAMGGIVNIITKKASEKTEASASVSGGSYKTYNTTISVRAPVNNKVNIATFSNYEQSAGYPILSPAHRIGNMGYSEFSTMNNITWAINQNSSVNTNLFYVQNSMQFRGDDVYGKMFMSSIDYKQRITSKLHATSRIKYSHWDAEQSGEKNEIFNPEIYFSWNKFDKHDITFGGEFRSMTFSRTSVLEHNQKAFGTFLQDEIHLDKFSLLMALRFDKVENIDPVVSPKIAVMYQLFEKIRLRASFGKGFHAPTVQELYEEGYGHGGRAYRFGNPDLQPEYSLTTTFGIEWNPLSNLQFLAYGYYNTITDMITPIYDGIWEDNPDTTKVIDRWVRTNIHEAEIFGFETSFRYRINKNLQVEGGYNYAENKNKSTGGQLPYYPGESFFSKFIYNSNLSQKISFSYFLSLRATMNRSAWNWKPEEGADIDNPNGLITELKDYQLVNSGVKLSYDKKLDVWLNVGNILGQNIERLDDSFTVIDGEPTYKISGTIWF